MKKYIIVCILLIVLISITGIASAQNENVNLEPTGDGVNVGIIDSKYDIDNPAIVSNVENFKAFGTHNAFNSPTAHGTETAEVVTQQASGVNLHIAAVNELDTQNFTKAVDWLVEEDVDIIVASIGYHGQPYDGTGVVSNATKKAYSNGILFVSSAGNEAEDHWIGDIKNKSGDEYGTFIPENQNKYSNSTLLNVDANYVSDTYTFSIYISRKHWDEKSGNYELYIRDKDTGDKEYITDINLEERKYVKRIVSTQHDPQVMLKPTSNVSMEDIQIFTTFAGIEQNHPRSSMLAPATSPYTVAVGACKPVDSGDDCIIEDFSSRGPTVDGRRGIDLVAPDRMNTSLSDEYIGTSASAPYVGGLAAVKIEEENYSISRKALEKALLNSTESKGNNYTYGTGIIKEQKLIEYEANKLASTAKSSVISLNLGYIFIFLILIGFILYARYRYNLRKKKKSDKYDIIEP